MDGVKQGNSFSDGTLHRHWLIGHFIHEDPYRQTHDVEVKWGVHNQGDCKPDFVADQVARSLSILVRGRFRLTFRNGPVVEDVVLEKEGDYAIWLPGIEHKWVAEASGETVIVTVRWPSLPTEK